ncbi:hypothetical protein GF325_06440, partial [Candidatus Bathyarchaeota archaeon]|nr:hypothetical protein [Candidatus Bathyarchaeota archaeon]
MNSNKTERRMNLIILLNKLVEASPTHTLMIKGIDENNSKTFSIEIILKDEFKEVKMNGINHRDFASLLWAAGMLPTKNHQDLSTTINTFLKEQGNRPRALALDTNLIYSRFMHNFIEISIDQPFQSIPFMIIVGRGTNDEMHYKTSLTYKSLEAYSRKRYEQFCDLLLRDSEVSMLLVHDRDKQEASQRLRGVSSREGRRGLKGLLYFRKLQKNYHVIVSKPVHLYYANHMIGKPDLDLRRLKNLSKGDEVLKILKNIVVEYPDAVYDSIIRHEVEFMRDNTNLEIMFLTADKNNDESSETEGLRHSYVQQPTYWQE